MNLYTNNCRIFCARMARQVAILNAEEADRASAARQTVAADVQLVLHALPAVALPLLYPAALLSVLWAGLGDLLF